MVETNQQVRETVSPKTSCVLLARFVRLSCGTSQFVLCFCGRSFSVDQSISAVLFRSDTLHMRHCVSMCFIVLLYFCITL